MTLRQLAYDFFESDELRILFMRAATTSTGCFPDDVPGLQGLVHNLPLVLSFEPAAIAVGGSQAISDALVSAGRKLGVEYFTSAEVDRDRRRGRAARPGSSWPTARGSTPTSWSASSGCRRPSCGCCATSSVDRPLAHRIRNIHYDRGQLLWANLALHEPPRYAAEASNPGVGPQPRLLLGAEGPRLPRHSATSRRSTWTGSPAGRTCSARSTALGQTRAPAGRHIVGVEEFAAPRRLFSDDRLAAHQGRASPTTCSASGALRAEHDAATT